jgi:hypothetical protein
MLRQLASLLLTCALVALAWPALAWSEHRIIGDEVRLEVDTSGVATIEHRLAVRLNGSEPQRALRLQGIDPDAAPLPNAYVVPAAEALGNSLASAVPLKLSLVEGAPAGEDGAAVAPAEDDGRELELAIDDDKGILRGNYVFVFRYRTDLKARGLVRREGAMLLAEWRGPSLGVGLDNLRTVWRLPPAPTAPRASEPSDDGDATGFLSEVRRAADGDEIELLRTYAPEGARVLWTVRADPRAIEGLAGPIDAAVPTVLVLTPVKELVSRRALHVAAALLLVAIAALVGAKAREVQCLAEVARAKMPPVVPAHPAVRASLAGLAFAGGVWLELVSDRPVEGALAVLVATVLAAYGVARLDPTAALRGPGRWLAVSEREALVDLPPPRGVWLDVGSRGGKLLFAVALLPFVALSAWLGRRAPHQSLLVALDAVVLLAIFGTGRLCALPADLASEPAPFFKKLVAMLRKRHGSDSLRLVPRVRIPLGEVDADELRLLVVPRLPLRGFASIEVAMTYAVGLGARVGMPEVLLRVVAGSPCDQALASLSRRARITPGRKAEERVFAFTPRLPTVAMTSEIVLALASRVTDTQAVRADGTRVVKPDAAARPRTKARAA